MISLNDHLKTALLGVVNCKLPQKIIKDEANQPETNQSEHKAAKCLTVKRERLRNSSQQFIPLGLIWFQVAMNVSVLLMTKVRHEVGVVTVLMRSKALTTKLIIVDGTALLWDCSSKWLVSNINRFRLHVKFKCKEKIYLLQDLQKFYTKCIR